MARGSIRKRGKKYSIIVDTYDENNKRKQCWISGFKTKKEAELELPKILSEINGGVFVSDRKIGFSNFANKWLGYVKDEVKPSTYVTYDWVMTKAKERFNQIPIIKIKPLMIQDFISSNEKLSINSKRYLYRVLNMAFNEAVRLQITPNNPCLSVTPPSREKKIFKPYTDEQIATLIAGAKQTEIYVPVLIAIGCGLRRGEICSINWEQIDFKNNMLYVLGDVKTENSARAVAAPQFIINELKPLRGIGNVVNLLPDFVYKRFKKLIKELDLPDISFHALRHMSASLLLKNGVPIKVISERLGHSSTSFTMDIYAHLMLGMQQEAASVMDGVLNPVSKSLSKKKKASKQ